MVRYPSDDFLLRYVLEYNASAFFALLTHKDQRVIKYAVRTVVADLSGPELTSVLMAWKTLGNHQEDDWPRFGGASFYSTSFESESADDLGS